MIHPRTRIARAAGAGAILLLALLLPFAAARAQTSDVFEVRDVDVDVTADSAAAARDKAVLEGQRMALDTLLGRIASKDDAARLGHLSDDQITNLVQDFEVEQERTSAVRYIGKLAFHFRAGAVRDMLGGGGQSAPTGSAGAAVLIVPVLTSAGKSELWEDDNGWRAAWAARPAGSDVVPLVVPLGGAEEMATIDAAQALAGDSAKLNQLAQRNKAGDILVVEAQLDDAATPGQKTVTVTAHRYGANGPQESFQDKVTGDGQNLGVLYASAAQRIADHVQNGVRQRAVAGGSELTLAVRVPLAGLASWVEIRRRLAKVAAIKRGELTYLSRQEARLNLVFVGDQSQLAQAVAQRDLSLTEAPDGWVLAATAGGGTAAPADGAANPTN